MAGNTINRGIEPRTRKGAGFQARSVTRLGVTQISNEVAPRYDPACPMNRKMMASGDSKRLP
jgi:hypothetical protein